MNVVKFFIVFYSFCDAAHFFKSIKTFKVEISAIKSSTRLRPRLSKNRFLPNVKAVTTYGRSPWTAHKFDKNYYMFSFKRNRKVFYLTISKGNLAGKQRLSLTQRKLNRRNSLLFKHKKDLSSGRQLLQHVKSRKYVSIRGIDNRYALPTLVRDKRQAAEFIIVHSL